MIGIGGVGVGLLVGLVIAFTRNAPERTPSTDSAEGRPWPPIEDGRRSEDYRKAAVGKDAKPPSAPGGDDLRQ
ncbi:MAG: hypothetical protein ACKO1M_05655, partial [Planctomycetota bacterium]